MTARQDAELEASVERYCHTHCPAELRAKAQRYCDEYFPEWRDFTRHDWIDIAWYGIHFCFDETEQEFCFDMRDLLERKIIRKPSVRQASWLLHIYWRQLSRYEKALSQLAKTKE
jgi:hypothetical protein